MNKVRHFMDYTFEAGLFLPETGTMEISEKDIHKVVLPYKSIYRVVLYDVITTTIEHEGKTYEASTGRVNEEEFLVGKFFSTEEVLAATNENNAVYKSLKAKGAIGEVGRCPIFTEAEKNAIISPSELHYKDDKTAGDGGKQ